ncbi:MAG: amidohydrolase family protein, partial [Clostridia bacterium]|nr:amidohydrolase family protein [Clostridia bacterium]
WDLSSGKLNMNSFPEIDGKTFEGAYLDEAMTKPVTETLTGDIDYEHGVSATERIRVYTKFAEGEWYRISTAEQFVKNSKLGGCYYIEADLDFTALNWSAALAGGAFTGRIEGNGHKFSNITFIQGHPHMLYERLIREYPNMYICTCAGIHFRTTEDLVDAFGADKILVGSDSVIFDPTFGIGPVAFADISEENKRKILGENAKKLMEKIKEA